MRAALIAIATVVAFGTAQASPLQELGDARSSFRAKDWQSARRVLKDLLYPDARLARPSDLVDAHVLLGIVHFELGDRDDAKFEFRTALAIDPTKTLEPPFYTTSQIRIFDEVRADVEDARKRQAEERRIAEQADAIRRYKESLRVVETRSYVYNFFPFGQGQIQNKHTRKGIAFAVGQGLTASVSLGIFLYLGGKYGLASNNVPLEDGPRVRRLQQIEVGAGIAFYGLWAWSVIDALVYYKPRERIEADDSLLPDELKRELGTKPRPKKTSLRDRLRFGPILVPDGVGLGLSLEND